MPYDGLFKVSGPEYGLRRFKAVLVFLSLVLTEKMFSSKIHSFYTNWRQNIISKSAMQVLVESFPAILCENKVC